MSYPPGYGQQPPQDPRQPGYRPQYPPQQQPYGGYQPGHGYQLPPPPPRNSNTGLIIMLVIGIPLLLLGGCVATVTALGGNTSTAADEQLRATPDATQPADSAPAETAAPAENPADTGQATANAPADQGQVAKIGETITVAGINADTQIAVTLNRVIDKGTAANQFLTADAGNKLVAVELTIKNAGTAVYSDSPILGAAIIDSEGRQHRTSLADITEGVSFGGAVTIAVGDSRKGLIVFEMPDNAVLAKLQFGATFAQQKGEWALS